MANKFYVHNDIFRYEDEVFGDSEAELDEGKVLINVQTLLWFCFCFFAGDSHKTNEIKVSWSDNALVTLFLSSSFLN